MTIRPRLGGQAPMRPDRRVVLEAMPLDAIVPELQRLKPELDAAQAESSALWEQRQVVIRRYEQIDNEIEFLKDRLQDEL